MTVMMECDINCTNNTQIGNAHCTRTTNVGMSMYYCSCISISAV